MDTIGKIDKSIRCCYYRITRQWCIYITCVYSIFNTSRRIYDLLRVMLNWWRIYGDANNLATIIYRALFRLVEETGNAEECIIVTRFSEILNFQAVKLSEGEGGAEISNVHTWLGKCYVYRVKPGHRFRFSPATRKNHVRKIRARKLYAVKSGEGEEGERGVELFPPLQPRHDGETSNSSDPTMEISFC